MKLDVLDNRDFWAGLMLIGTGALSIYVAREYPFGTTLRMGSGYMPTVLGGLLVLFGLYLAVKGLRSNEKIESGWSLRALIIIPLSFVAFGFLMDRAGFVPALSVLVVGAALAGKEFKLTEVVLLAALLTAASVVVFVWGLGLPYPLFTWF